MVKPIGGLFWGTQEFVETFKKQISKNKHRDFPGKRDLFKVSEAELKNKIDSKDQAFQVYCLWKYARLNQKEIGRRFSITDSAVCHSVEKV